MGTFYRDLFSRRGLCVTATQNSSRAVILEAEDGRGSTVARVAIRSSFDNVQAFLAVTNEWVEAGAQKPGGSTFRAG